VSCLEALPETRALKFVNGIVVCEPRVWISYVERYANVLHHLCGAIREEPAIHVSDGNLRIPVGSASERLSELVETGQYEQVLRSLDFLSPFSDLLGCA
jgi:hypothetical protein